MAGEIGLSQAMSYARDLKGAYEALRARERELVEANERLRKAYQQSLRYARDLKKTYGRLQRAILQGLLGLANALEAKDPYTRGHSARVAELSLELALRMAVASREPDAGLLHHLDRGSEFTSERYQSALREQGIQVSMSCTGNCWDNAAMESFFATLTRVMPQSKAFSYPTRGSHGHF